MKLRFRRFFFFAKLTNMFVFTVTKLMNVVKKKIMTLTKPYRKKMMVKFDKTKTFIWRQCDIFDCVKIL